MKILLVVMPFSSIRPNLGVSLIQSHLSRIDVNSRVLYLSMRYAQQVGEAIYQAIGEHVPSESLAGDWVFRECLSGTHEKADADYLTEFVQHYSPSDNPLLSRDSLERCRSMAEPFLAECLDAVAWQSYDVVGFTSTFSQHVACLALAKRVKARFPTIPIVFGGANCEDAMGLQTHRSFPFIDFVCSGEADRSFPELVMALRDGRSSEAIGGVISRRDGISRFSSLSPYMENQLDNLPIPNYDDFFEQLEECELTQPNGGDLPMESSRGCWWGQKHHCTFCGLNGSSMAFRSKSGRRVIEEMEELSNRYQQLQFGMVDNIFPMKYFADMLPALKRRQVKLSLFYETKANLTKPQLRSMREAGIVAIQPGIESLSTDVLRLMRKGITGLQNIQLLKWCREFGIVPHWNLLYGFPGEEGSDYEAMANMMDALHHLQPPHGIDRIRLDRFSPNFYDAANLGIVNIRPVRNYSLVYDLPENEVADIAYFFNYEYADGRDPDTYTGAARDAVARWRANRDNRGLHCVDHGNSLVIWDFRPGAVRTVTVLKSCDRTVYLYCDQHRSLQQILALPEVDDQASSVVPVLNEWISNRLMIGLDGQYLALAVHVEPPGVSVGAQGTEVLEAE
jgi:ribosomal peptide maturation radical SAM protein 1